MIPKGKGKYKICADGKPLLLISRKVDSLVNAKVKPIKVKWTSSSRQFFKKDTGIQHEKKIRIKTEKIVRGFPNLPQKTLEKMRERNQKIEKSEFKGNERISKKANVFVKK
ncbi:hypothetical protein DMUE_3387 [Dictyocoela muelleri]|nr:hypothetical protein DMUE_3387 [Dictyocoela muelleri]